MNCLKNKHKNHSVPAETFSAVPYQNRVDEGTCGRNLCPNSKPFPACSDTAKHAIVDTEYALNQHSISYNRDMDMNYEK